MSEKKQFGDLVDRIQNNWGTTNGYFLLSQLSREELKEVARFTTHEAVAVTATELLQPEELEVLFGRGADDGNSMYKHTITALACGIPDEFLTEENFLRGKKYWKVRRIFARRGPLEIVRKYLLDDSDTDVQITALHRLPLDEAVERAEGNSTILRVFLEGISQRLGVQAIPAKHLGLFPEQTQVEWVQGTPLALLTQLKNLDPSVQRLVSEKIRDAELVQERNRNQQLEARVAQLEETIARWTEPPLYSGSIMEVAEPVVEVAEPDAPGMGTAMLEGAVGAVASRLLGEKAKLLTETGRGAKMEELLSEL